MGIGMGPVGGMMVNMPTTMSPTPQTPALTYGMAPPHLQSHDGVLFPASQRCTSPLGYTHGGENGGGGFMQQQSQQPSRAFPVLASAGRSSNGGAVGGPLFSIGGETRGTGQDPQAYGSGGYHGRVLAGSARVSIQNHGQAPFSTHIGNVGMGWAAELGRQGSYLANQDGSNVTQNQSSEVPSSVGKSLKQHRPLGHREPSTPGQQPLQSPPTTTTTTSANNGMAPQPLPPVPETAALADKVIDTQSGALPAPIRVAHALGNQSSLPLSGIQAVLAPVKIAQTPPTEMSGLGFLGSGGGGVGAKVPNADAVAAAAAIAGASVPGTGGASEAWARERLRLSLGGRGSSPKESRIASVAIAAQKAAVAVASMARKNAQNTPLATDISSNPAGGVSGVCCPSTSLNLIPASTDMGSSAGSPVVGGRSVAIGTASGSKVAKPSSSAVEQCAMESAPQLLESKEAAVVCPPDTEHYRHGSNGGGRVGGDAGRGGTVGNGVEAALVGLSIAGGGGDDGGARTALPGLSDFTSTGSR